MNMAELDHALRKLRLGGMASTLEVRLLEAQSEKQAPIDPVSALVRDELVRRQDRLLDRRLTKARFRDPDKTLDGFDFGFDKQLPCKFIFELATERFVEKCEDVLLLGPPGTGKSHLVQAIGTAAVHQRHRVDYREAHALIEEVLDAARRSGEHDPDVEPPDRGLGQGARCQRGRDRDARPPAAPRPRPADGPRERADTRERAVAGEERREIIH